MRNPLIAALLVGASVIALAQQPAAAASRIGTGAPPADQELVVPAREASEGPRREDRRQDRREDRRQDRRTSAFDSQDAPFVLAREASEGPRREDRRQDRREDRRQDRRTSALETFGA